MMKKEQTLISMLQKAEKACDKGGSTLDFEAELVELVEYIQQDSCLQSEAEKQFLDGVRNYTLCWELVSFCMHILRYESVRREIETKLSLMDDPRQMHLAHILDAYSDDWEDRDMYTYFG